MLIVRFAIKFLHVNTTSRNILKLFMKAKKIITVIEKNVEKGLDVDKVLKSI